MALDDRDRRSIERVRKLHLVAMMTGHIDGAAEQPDQRNRGKGEKNREVSALI
jgi:hypothetical protein